MWVFVFPHSYRCPTDIAEPVVGVAVALDVAAKFLLPPTGVRLR
jgi:hypothetical protein